MKNKTILSIFNIILSLSILPLVSAEDNIISNRRVMLMYGFKWRSVDMELIKTELTKRGIPEDNIEILEVPDSESSLVKNAQYIGNYIKDTFDGRKVIVIAYSIGEDIINFLTRNQEEAVTFHYRTRDLTYIDAPFGKLPISFQKIFAVTTSMPTHMEQYISEVIFVREKGSKF